MRGPSRLRFGIAAVVLLFALPLAADVLIGDDLIVQGSTCAGLDCTNGEVFDDDTLRLSENNLRIDFDDTGDPALAPANRWRITANDSSNGGAGRFSIDDRDGPATPFDTGLDIGAAVGADLDDTRAIAIGDVDLDDLPDVVVGNDGEPNRYYPNGGASDPFSAATGVDVTADANATTSLALADFDGDAELDVVAGNRSEANRVYLNQGLPTPFTAGQDLTAAAENTTSVLAIDLSGAGGFDPDIVVGNEGQVNRVYLNNGSVDPFGGVASSTLTSDVHATTSLAAGAIDLDADVDVVAGNRGQTNRLYLNNGGADPFSGVTGTDISGDTHQTTAIAVGDVNGDLLPDVVAGNDGQPNRLYLNNGSADPFAGVVGTDVTSDADATTSVAIQDFDGDGFVDVLAGNADGPDRFYPHNGTLDPASDPFAGVAGRDVPGTGGGSAGLTATQQEAVQLAPGFVQTIASNAPGLAVARPAAENRFHPRLDSDGGTSPWTVEAGAPADALRVTAAGQVAVGTAVPDPSATLEVTGGLRVVGDVRIAAGQRTGIVTVADFGGARTATVSFERPYTRDYVVVLTAIGSTEKAKLSPNVIARDPTGFTITSGGKLKKLAEVHWTTRWVGEF